MGKITKKQELMNWANKTVITQDIVPCSPLCRTFIYTYGRQSTYVTHRLRDLYYRHFFLVFVCVCYFNLQMPDNGSEW